MLLFLDTKRCPSQCDCRYADSDDEDVLHITCEKDHDLQTITDIPEVTHTL